MKPGVDRATTRKVLGDIDAVLRERTAEAVDRVLETATPDIWGGTTSGDLALIELFHELGIERRPTLGHVGCGSECDCRGVNPDDIVDNATPGMGVYLGSAQVVPPAQRRRYAPEAVSPHLFGGTQ